jgi:16S rRNA (guanine527-N7)-methyltransferase
MMNETQWCEALAQQGILLSRDQRQQFHRYYEWLIQENAKYNLTAITEQEEVYEKHFYDSLSLAWQMKWTTQRVCDVGAGAGFPGIPLALVNPTLQLVPLDATAKKMDFLRTLKTILPLPHVQPEQGRAEEYHQKPFDVVLARGVATLPILLELVANLVRIGGMVIAMKGPNYVQELQEAQTAIALLGYRLERVEPYVLPTHQEQRFNLYFIKEKKHSLAYPRKYAKIKQRPLL